MKIPFGIIISFIAGAAVGIGGTYKYFDCLHRARADEEIESVKEKLLRRTETVAKIVRHGDTAPGDRRTYASMDNRPDPSEIVNVRTEVHEEPTMADNPMLVEDGYPNTDDINDEECQPDRLNPNATPYLISENQFFDDKTFEKDELVYYEGDETLADSKDEIVDNVRETVGDCLNSFDDGNDGFIYIRNERLGLDFEVQRMEKSYQEAIYGYIPPSGRNSKKARERAKRGD